jgi:hypothetical protein
MLFGTGVEVIGPFVGGIIGHIEGDQLGLAGLHRLFREELLHLDGGDPGSCRAFSYLSGLSELLGSCRSVRYYTRLFCAVIAIVQRSRCHRLPGTRRIAGGRGRAPRGQREPQVDGAGRAFEIIDIDGAAAALPDLRRVARSEDGAFAIGIDRAHGPWWYRRAACSAGG